MLKQIPRSEENISQPQELSDAALAETTLENHLALHQIEAELLGEYPRRIRRSPVGRDLMLIVLLPSLSLGLMDALNAHLKAAIVNWIIGITCVFGLSFGIGSWISETRQAMRRKSLLQSGKAQPAQVTDMRPAKLGRHLEYAYQTTRGGVLFRSLVISPQDAQNLRIGSTFTVLVSSKDERNVMPYFLAGEHKVINGDTKKGMV